MFNLSLSASFENWKLFWLRRTHPRFQPIAQKVFERDQYTCQFCSIAAPLAKFEVINLDANYQNNKASNLVTACPLCAQCCFIESIGTGSFGGGVLINLPEISQNQLNALVNEAFLATHTKSAQAVSAENILRDFKFRSADVEKIFGDGMSDPAKFGMLMLTANLPKAQLNKILLPLRLLPIRTRFLEFTESVANSLAMEETQAA
jgi:intracellular multiplication protein IcmJ